MTGATQQDGDSIPFIEISSQNPHALVRLVSSPVTVNDGTRIVAVLDREDGKLKMLAADPGTFACFARWGMENNSNPCGNDEGVDWSLCWNWITNKPDCVPGGGPFSCKLTDDEVRFLDSEEPIYPRMMASAARKYGSDFVDAARKSLLVSSVRNSSQEEFEPTEICRDCGGRCCLIYLTPKKGGVGSLALEDDAGRYCPDAVEMVHRAIHAGRDYGVTPRYNPVELYSKDAAAMSEELKEKGVARGACEYQGEGGCLIPRDKRPRLCNMYRCGLWRYNWL